VSVLLDTHAFLWWIDNDRRLGAAARSLIANGTGDVLLSVVSGWELAIKWRLGRITMPDDYERFVEDQIAINRLQLLPVLLPHALRVGRLALHHRDPFDRLLIAQAQIEGLPIVTADRVFAAYGVATIPADA